MKFYSLFNSKMSTRPAATFDEFVEILSSNVAHLNSENRLNLEKLYTRYIEIFPNIIRTQATKINPSILGLNNRCTTLQFYLDRGWSVSEAKEKLKNRQNLNSIDKIQTNHKCTKEEARRILSNRHIKANISLNSRPDIALINKAKGKSVRIEYWLDKINPDTGMLFTPEEAKLALKIRQETGFKNFWGDVKAGKKIYHGNTSLEYYLRRAGDVEGAMSLLRKRQSTFSLNKCIEKFGEDVGLRRWRERQQRWLTTLANKSPEEKKRILVAKTIRSKRFSKEAGVFIRKLLSAFSINANSDNVYYEENEYFIYENGKIFFYDLYLKSLNCMIEYNGSSFHPNPLLLNTPSKWNSWRHPFLKLTADQQKEKDELKKRLVLEKGMVYFCVWDTDNHAQKISEICKTLGVLNATE